MMDLKSYEFKKWCNYWYYKHTPTYSGQMTTPWFGAVVSIITESNVILPMDPALFSAYIDIMLGFPANNKNIINT